MAHGGAGKTSLAEVMLYNAGATTRLGRVEDGNTAMDFEPEEIKRTSSISSGFHQFDWKKHTISLIDTPGDQNFFSDTKMCVQAAETAIVVVDAVDGVKVQTEQAWDFAKDFNLACMIFINKLDRERADFTRTFQDTVNCFEPKPILFQLPIGSENDFKGVVDLISMKAFVYDEDGTAKKIDIPSDMLDEAETERESLIENIAETNDALLEKYLEGETLLDEEILAALKKGVFSRAFVPVLCGSATLNIGIDLLSDFIVNCTPSPVDLGPKIGASPDSEEEIERKPDPDAPFSGFVFKTIADPYAGRLSIFKVVSGRIGADGNFYNVHKETKNATTSC